LGFSEDIQTILDYSHFWNWAPDWAVVRDIYASFPESYSVLTPFAYTYLEELVRSRTTSYGMSNPTDRRGNIRGHSTGQTLFNLAKRENADDAAFVTLVGELYEKYYGSSGEFDRGDNRNSTMHGYMHPRYWTKESFEDLIHDIARLSPYSGF
jgi:hypothetical protein